ASFYSRAREEYEEILRKDPKNGHVQIYLACCLFMLGMYKEAEEAAMKGPKSPLQTRVLFHVAHKQNNEEKLMDLHRQLQDVIEDQIDSLALNVYVALCYYKLDYYDISQEVLDVYLKKHPESATAINLSACNQYRLYNGKAAENDLKQFLEKMSTSFNYAKELFRHNMVVFQNGEGALQVLPALVDVIPEARLNLVVYYLKEGNLDTFCIEYIKCILKIYVICMFLDDLDNAYELMKDVEPLQPAEYILKGVVNAA
ncbi:unnamed protein product, partial [Didymodactylos carnosus]